MSRSPRRSSRIKAKEAEKEIRRTSSQKQVYWNSTSSSDSDDDGEGAEELIAVVNTPSRSRITPQKPNNFTKVYNSYNRDYGLDVYEGDFIDDFIADEVPYSTPKSQKRVKRRQLTSQMTSSSDSSSDSDVGRKKRLTSQRKSSSSSDSDVITPNRNAPKRLVLSSDEEEAGARVKPGGAHGVRVGGARTDPGSDSEQDEVQVTSRKRHKSQFLSSSDEDDGEEEEEEEGEGGTWRDGKSRKVKKLESDEEIDGVGGEGGAVRTPSSRAQKLKEEKLKRAEQVLKKYKECRTDSKGTSSDIALQSSEEEEEEDQDQIFHNSFMTSNHHVGKSDISLAEQLLFPPRDDSENSSEEESDWIVSDGEDEYVDLKAMLAWHGGEDEKILYHPEAKVEGRGGRGGSWEGEGGGGGGGGMFVTDKELEDILSSPLIDVVCRVGEGGGVEAVRRVIAAHSNQYELDATDDKGYTALMYAVDKGDSPSVRALLEAGASIDCKDENGTTPLHLAALSGWLECVKALISHQHKVDCLDDRGWPPLLYAHFQNHQDCVLALMKAKPEQLSVLGDLLRQSHSAGMENRKKTLKVIRSLLMSLAHEEAYYSMFNQFVRCHPSVLEEDGFSFLKHCMGLLSFENKQAWLRRKLRKLREYADMRNYCGSWGVNVSREDVLSSVWRQLRGADQVMYWLRPLCVTFKGEQGICSGPRKEFYSCLVKALARGDEKLFSVCDNGQISLQPCEILLVHSPDAVNSAMLDRHHQLLGLVAQLVAHAVFHGETIELHLTTPMIKQLLGLSLEHPADLEDVDKSFYHSVSGLLDGAGEIEDLELTFTHTLLCPWTKRTIDFPLCEGGRTKSVTEQNKHDYTERLSRFKLEGCIKQELGVFTSAFWKVVPQQCLEVFTPSELVLLISGVPHIDVADWEQHTRYYGLKESDSIVRWFWKLVRSLKEEEKALLLKFSTGSPCVPAGGFASLQGLGGVVPFTIRVIPGINKVPQAATCFNTLKLTDYSNEQQFRNKILIAIRYGCEGFEFS